LGGYKRRSYEDERILLTIYQLVIEICGFFPHIFLQEVIESISVGQKENITF